MHRSKSVGLRAVVGWLVVLGAAYYVIPGSAAPGSAVQGSEQANALPRAPVEPFKLGEGKKLGGGPAKENRQRRRRASAPTSAWR